MNILGLARQLSLRTLIALILGLEVLITLGCEGELLAFDGETGHLKWIQQLGPRTIGSPSIADLDGDGILEIVVPSYDGSVWFLGGP